MSDRLAKKVLLIGWDAADWNLLRPMISAGQMPSLARLIETGVSGNLATLQPVLSPMLWTSIATGKRADKHGICGFAEPLPDGSGIRPVTCASRRTKAVWNILSQNGLASNVVSWLATHPAETVRGAVVSDYFLHPESLGGGTDALAEGVCHPSRLRPLLANLLVNPRDLGPDALLPFVPRAGEVDRSTDRRIEQLATLLARASSTHAVACALIANEPWDFTAVYYDMIDQVGHLFMPFHPPHMAGVSEHDAQVYGEVVRGCYRFHDMMLGAMLDLAGDDTTVMLVSDHGFHCDERRSDVDGFLNPTAWHRQQGVVCVSGPGVRRGAEIQSAGLLDVTPTVLSLLGIPVGRDMQGRPWREILESSEEPSYVDSWDSIDGDSGAPPSASDDDPVASATALQLLVDLGYVEAPSEDFATTVLNTTVQLKTNLALAMMDGGQLQQAADVWSELLAFEGLPAASRRAFRAELADCAGQLGRFDESRALLEQNLADAPDDPAALFKLAQLQVRANDTEGALGLLDRLEGSAALAIPTKVLRAQCLVKLRQLESAAGEFLAILQLDDEHATALSGLARVAYLEQDWRGSAEIALRAIGLDPRLSDAHQTLGLSLVELGRRREAIEALEVSLKLDPHQPALRSRLTRLRQANLESDEAPPESPFDPEVGARRDRRGTNAVKDR
ncbi:Type I phosphodiesterase / nucleotide pyrophosphatase [Botrimarina colliarenosi]|uniref:Type I phosphodiesterase / nucleotide pyrophosphatase n=1 Tax=Botrimarina colliarenosi TaxID=2528001 RepID=A0A5C6A1N9_9BACT|nr:alkaline phosphatase family protein [Botrimarina colliarenosi]TWT92453.1 Type I phosphodiesterase / nucleotide pyrophosphatase [Botrimarina colliarenosi]